MSEFSEKDLPLKRDVSRLGETLGELLQTLSGDEVYQRVESTRRWARAWRDDDDQALDTLQGELGGLAPKAAQDVVRAFSTYFGLVNLAEHVHRIRRSRTYMHEDAPPQPGGFEAALIHLKENGVPAKRAAEVLLSLQFEPVFTAHPTQSVRRSILQKEQRIAEALVSQLNPSHMLPIEIRQSWERIRSEIALTWHTDEQLRVKPSVQDEVEYVTFYMSDILYRIIPALHARVRESFESVYGVAAAEEVLWHELLILRPASWVGGDMDGNPYVNADTLELTLRRQRSLILRLYRQDMKKIFSHLSISSRRVELPAHFVQRLDSLESNLDAANQLPERYLEMPFRRFVHAMDQRLKMVAEGRDSEYSALRFLHDVELLGECLNVSANPVSGGALVRRLFLRVKTFGFHLAALDVRQDASELRECVKALLGEDLADVSESRRDKLLEQWIENPPKVEGFDAVVKKNVDVFCALARLRSEYGQQALGSFIISMANSSEDIWAVVFLAAAGGLLRLDEPWPLDIMPLFETVPDMEAAVSVLDTLLMSKRYQKHLETRQNVQWVMLGYSDSAKQGGVLASRVALYEIQEKLANWEKKQGVRVALFHGRGGTVSRGGSKPRAAVLGSPNRQGTPKLRVTEQGEIIHAKYGLREIALRTVELYGAAMLESVLANKTPAPDELTFKYFKDASEVARAHYRGVVYESAWFFDFFREMTPIDVISTMHIGSRPPSRKKQDNVGALRAIPWVFAWTQCRFMLPGWLGVSAGLARLVDQLGIDTVREYAESKPLLQTLLLDLHMLLAKADLRVATHYRSLLSRPLQIHFDTLSAEFESCVEWVCRLTNTSELLEHDPVLKRSIALRNPYVDPMSLIQVDLLKRWRHDGSKEGELHDALVASVVGIARGLQNTG